MPEKDTYRRFEIHSSYHKRQRGSRVHEHVSAVGGVSAVRQNPRPVGFGNDVLIGWELVYYYGKALKSIARSLSRGALLRPARPYWVPRGPDSSFGTLIR